jgi:hypothetical protein
MRGSSAKMSKLSCIPLDYTGPLELGYGTDYVPLELADVAAILTNQILVWDDDEYIHYIGLKKNQAQLEAMLERPIKRNE